MSLHIDHEQRAVTFDGPITIHTVQAMRMELIATLSNNDWTVDLSGVTELDSAGLQLLVAWKRSLPEIRLHSLPEPARQRCDLTGLSAILF